MKIDDVWQEKSPSINSDVEYNKSGPRTTNTRLMAKK